MKKVHQPLRKHLPDHPSGRPYHHQKTKGLSIWRIPNTEPNVPRLRKTEQPSAIGFTAHIGGNWDAFD